MTTKCHTLLLLLFAAFAAGAQQPNAAYTAHALAYIAQYKALAIAEQQRSGVPAAITLAQASWKRRPA